MHQVMMTHCLATLPPTLLSTHLLKDILKDTPQHIAYFDLQQV